MLRDRARRRLRPWPRIGRVRAGGEQPRQRQRLARELGSHRRTPAVEEPTRQSAGQLLDPEPAADRARLPRYVQRTGREPAGDRRGRVAQPERDPGRQSHARRVQSQQAAVVRNPGRGQRGRRDAQRPGDHQSGDGYRAALCRAEGRRGAARIARRRLPPWPQRRRAPGRRLVRQLDRHRHPAAGQARWSSTFSRRRCRATSSGASTSPTSGRRC